MSDITLEITARPSSSSRANRALRRRGIVPGVLYGQGRAPFAFQVETPKLRAALSTDAGNNAILQLTVDGEAVPAILQDFQLDPVRDRVTHVDLLAINMLEAIHTTVPILLEGELEDGVLTPGIPEVEVSCLPGDLPDHIVVDISSMSIGDTLRVGDVPPPTGVEWITAEDEVIASASAPITEEQLEESLAGDATDEGETSAEPGTVGGDEDADGESE
jgi:large subunit ribosomal protein L25